MALAKGPCGQQPMLPLLASNATTSFCSLFLFEDSVLVANEQGARSRVVRWHANLIVVGIEQASYGTMGDVKSREGKESHKVRFALSLY